MNFWTVLLNNHNKSRAPFRPGNVKIRQTCAAGFALQDDFLMKMSFD